MNDTQHQVNVRVDTRYLPEQSTLEQNRFTFAYTVTIKNQDGVPAQLLSCHWVIAGGDGRTQEVRGASVIDEQPLITPGAQRTYTSGTVLATRVGSTRSSHQMLGGDGIAFDATIPAFRLAVPGALH